MTTVEKDDPRTAGKDGDVVQDTSRGLEQSWTWIGSIHGLDWIRWDDCDPVFN